MFPSKRSLVSSFIGFLKDENGTTVEYLVRIFILGLGSTTIFFGILLAIYQLGGKITNAIQSMDF